MGIVKEPTADGDWETRIIVSKKGRARAVGRKAEGRREAKSAVLFPRDPPVAAASIPKARRPPRLPRDRLLDRAGHQVARIDMVVHLAMDFISAGDSAGALRSLEQVGWMASRTRTVLRRADRV